MVEVSDAGFALVGACLCVGHASRCMREASPSSVGVADPAVTTLLHTMVWVSIELGPRIMLGLHVISCKARCIGGACASGPSPCAVAICDLLSLAD